jgi:hypothetical protein
LDNENYDLKKDIFVKNKILLRDKSNYNNIKNNELDSTFSIADYDFKIKNGKLKLKRVYIDTKKIENKFQEYGD